MKLFKLTIILVLFSISVDAQISMINTNNSPRFDKSRDLHADYYSIINSNRPGFSMSAYNVGVKYLQVEAGLQANPYLMDAGQSYLNSGLDISVRYGIDFDLELYTNISPNLDIVKTASDSTMSDFAISPAVFGATYRFSENKGMTPAMALSANFGYYNSRIEQYSDFELIFITQNSIGENWTLVSNWKLSQPINNINATYIITLTASLNKNLVWFVENVGYKGLTNSNSDFVETIHGGIGYLLSNDLQLDAFGGYNYNFNGFSSVYISAGVSWRFNMLRRKYKKPKGAESQF